MGPTTEDEQQQASHSSFNASLQDKEYDQSANFRWRRRNDFVTQKQIKAGQGGVAFFPRSSDYETGHSFLLCLNRQSKARTAVLFLNGCGVFVC